MRVKVDIVLLERRKEVWLILFILTFPGRFSFTTYLPLVVSYFWKYSALSLFQEPGSSVSRIWVYSPHFIVYWDKLCRTLLTQSWMWSTVFPALQASADLCHLASCCSGKTSSCLRFNQVRLVLTSLPLLLGCSLLLVEPGWSCSSSAGTSSLFPFPSLQFSAPPFPSPLLSYNSALNYSFVSPYRNEYSISSTLCLTFTFSKSATEYYV